MKLKNIHFRYCGVLLVGFGLAMTSCKKTWLDINTNPNSLPTPRPDYVFTGALNRAAATLDPNELGSYWSAQWTQSNTYIISSPQFEYKFNNTNFNYWDPWFDILQDFQYVLNNADKNNMPSLKGPAKIMKAYIFQQLVDLYGNIPYNDALKGAGSLAPQFDEQKTIYENLITLLDQGIADVKANPFDAITSGADIVFKGGTSGPTNWIKFANSLKLRILIRQSRVSGRDNYIITEINKASATTEGFLNAGQDVGSNPGYTNATNQTNPIYDRWGYDPNGVSRALGRYPRPTTYLFSILTASNDTFRLKRLFYPAGGESPTTAGVGVAAENVSNYVAIPYGISSGYLAQNTSPLGPAVITRGVNNPIILMTAAESFLLMSEAKFRYATVNLPLAAKDYYEQGVKESFRLTGTTTKYGADKATTLLASGIDLADWNASADKLKAIWMQKWLALVNYGGLEAWSEFRRTNYPNIPPSAQAPVGQKPPVRLYYPSTEVSSNGANVAKQGTIDVFNTRLFWDVD